ncbi:hypothetical protein LOTGIDRAFT_175650 [Lottia gigantea]|uniref:Uncharacterized protein n=1 Tax=Lottia gigantea TaxID=225164 RepID=V3ZMW0_LOTGI|nr:hypothetical protein LOTGIDRAFT_175650 [Lottia gigantea]ESO92713.1 hypothetical protein LOTGIDRAFT_175650 [Lottia gigantea]
MAHLSFKSIDVDIILAGFIIYCVNKDRNIPFLFDCKNGRILTAENGTLKCNCPLNTFGDDCNCRYKFTNKTTMFPKPYAEKFISDSAICDESCANDIRCSAAAVSVGTRKCCHYDTPIIFVSYVLNEDQCIEKCNEMSECKTIGIGNEMGLFCFVFNATFDKIPDIMKQTDTSAFSVAEKICE